MPSRFCDFLMKRRQFLWMVVIIGIGAFLRLINLNKLSFNNDELYNLVHIYNLDLSVSDFINPFLSWEIHPPLSHIIIYSWSKIFGISEVSLRFFTASLGIASIFFVFKITNLLFSEKTAIISSLLFSFNYASIALSKMATFHGMNIFFCSFSFYLGIRILIKPKVDQKTVYFYTVLLVLMGYINYFSMAFALFQLLLFSIYCFLFKKSHFRYYLFTFISTLVLFACWIPIIFKQYLNLKTHDYNRKPGDNAIIHLFDYIFNMQTVFWILIAILIFLKLLKKNTYQGRDKQNTFFILVFLTATVPILVFFIYNQIAQPLWKNHYFGFLTPFYSILAAYISQDLPFKNIKYAPIFFYLLISCLGFQHSTYDNHYPIVVEVRELIKTIIGENEARQQTCTYINHSWNKINFDYYFKQYGKVNQYLIENGELGKLQTAVGIQELDMKIKSRNINCVWFLNTYNQPSALLENYIDANFVKTKTINFERAYALLLFPK